MLCELYLNKAAFKKLKLYRRFKNPLESKSLKSRFNICTASSFSQSTYWIGLILKIHSPC